MKPTPREINLSLFVQFVLLVAVGSFVAIGTLDAIETFVAIGTFVPIGIFELLLPLELESTTFTRPC